MAQTVWVDSTALVTFDDPEMTLVSEIRKAKPDFLEAMVREYLLVVARQDAEQRAPGQVPGQFGALSMRLA